MGQKKKPSCYEFWQIIKIFETVLQKGNYEENQSASETRLPILHPVPSLKKETYVAILKILLLSDKSWCILTKFQLIFIQLIILVNLVNN